MNTVALKSVVRLFSITSLLSDENGKENHEVIIREYLKQYAGIGEIHQYSGMYQFYRNQLRKKEGSDFNKKLSSLSVKALQICYPLLEQLTLKERFILVVLLLEILKKQIHTNEIHDYALTISRILRINETDYEQIYSYVLNQYNNEILIYSGTNGESPNNVYWEDLEGEIHFVFFENINTCLIKVLTEENHIKLNDQEIINNKIYCLDWGETVRSHKFKPIVFSDVIKQFRCPGELVDKKLVIKNIEYSFKNNVKGIHPFNLDEETGQLIGIIGGSGTGKTTLLNLLNGNLKPEKGNIYLNGKDLHKNINELKSLIGYVPQDELLLEDLTVYQNLYFNAKLCFGDNSEDFLVARVDKILHELQLENIKNLKVGNPLQKVISGGQRKRLNIALELMREPSLFLVDEPTSGLSSNDSLKVMSLLKEQTFRGKLVFVNIHQPSSDIYKMFDKIIVLDKGGYIIYQGNPLDAIIYFKEKTHQIEASIRECVHCGNVKPEQILEIIEHPKIDEHGFQTPERAIEPKTWYSEYKKTIDPANVSVKKPENIFTGKFFKPPKTLTQFRIFFKRNLLSKIQDKQYLAISLFEAPLLAAILGYFSRFVAGTPENPSKYVFFENSNLPIYFFMSVIVALFVGLIVSAEQIIQDRKIINREKFLRLSRMSYLNSKIAFLFILSAIQMLLYVFIGSSILGIKGMNFKIWFVLFTIACNANMMGLNISAGLKSLVAIYVLVPLLIVPQLLLSGSAIKFDKLPKSLSSEKYVPVVGDIMVSRWAYEALMVNQFKNNRYNQNFFAIDKELSKINYQLSYLVPELEWRLMKLQNQLEKNEKIDSLLYGFVSNEIDKNFGFEATSKLKNEKISQWHEAVHTKKTELSRTKIGLIKFRDKQIAMMRKNHGEQYVIKIKERYHNQAVEDLVTARGERSKFIVTNDGILQKSDPVFRKPLSKIGRAHFFSPVKILGNYKINTLWFNILTIWLITFILYFLLLHDTLRKISELSVNKIYFILKNLF